MSKQLSKEQQKDLNALAWAQVRGILFLALGLGILGAIVFGPWGFIAGVLIGRSIAPTDKIHLFKDD